MMFVSTTLRTEGRCRDFWRVGHNEYCAAEQIPAGTRRFLIEDGQVPLVQCFL